jgi:hypothetical protein
MDGHKLFESKKRSSGKMSSNNNSPNNGTFYATFLEVISHSRFKAPLVTLLVLASGTFAVWQSLPEQTRLGVLVHFANSTGPTIDVELKPFEAMTGNSEVDFIKQKVERNFENLLAGAGLSVRSHLAQRNTRKILNLH